MSNIVLKQLKFSNMFSYGENNIINLNTIYDPCTYPGVRCTFYYKDAITDGKQVDEKDKSVSFMIFSGSKLLLSLLLLQTWKKENNDTRFFHLKTVDCYIFCYFHLRSIHISLYFVSLILFLSFLSLFFFIL